MDLEIYCPIHLCWKLKHKCVLVFQFLLWWSGLHEKRRLQLSFLLLVGIIILIHIY